MGNFVEDLTLSRTASEVLFIFGCLMVLEICVVFVLAVHRHASNLTNPLMQRSCIRIMLIGPVYSALCILALWKPELDLYVSIPIGIYEGYTMLSFFETIVIYLGGERKATLSLVAQTGQPVRSRIYLGFDMICMRLFFFQSSSGAQKSIGWHTNALAFDTGKDLYSFLKYSVTQYCIMKPISSIVIIILKEAIPNDSNKYHIVRVIDILILLIALQPLLQLYSAALPRLRGLGGDKIFMLLAIVVIVIFIQEFTTTIVCLEYVLEWNLRHRYIETVQIASVKYLTFFTIFEYTIFSNIFYRFFTPEIFDGTAAALWHGAEEKILMTPLEFVCEIFSFWKIFDDGASYPTIPRTSSWKGITNGAAAEQDDVDGLTDSAGSSEDSTVALLQETTKLL